MLFIRRGGEGDWLFGGMEKLGIVVLVCSVVLLSHHLVNGGFTQRRRSEDGSEEWGYVQVRPKAHMFWWLYRSPHRVEHPSKPWPLVIWLQGGPGASGVGIGNFEEIGPLDTYLNPRNSTWLLKADLLFVDSPVGTGYSFVEDLKLVPRNDEEAAIDVTTLLKELFNRNQTLQNSPVSIVAESYGGRFAVTVALSVLKAIEAGKLKLKLGGVGLGNSWISPEDYVFAWGSLLKDVSRLDYTGFQKSNSIAKKIKQQIANGEYSAATDSWTDLETLIAYKTNKVDFYNFMLDSGMDPVATMKKYSTYLSSLRTPGGGTGNLETLMNGPVKKQLKIIPKDVTWGGQSGDVFDAFQADFMRPRINEVDELLAKGINVTIYSGQLDIICATKGTEAWLEKLKWEGLQKFLSMDRTPIYCENVKGTRAFTTSYKNLHFYWVLGSGHFVPVDQPCIALKMLGEITESPAADSWTKM